MTAAPPLSFLGAFAASLDVDEMMRDAIAFAADGGAAAAARPAAVSIHHLHSGPRTGSSPLGRLEQLDKIA